MNQDTVAKQEEQAQSLTNEIQSADEDLHAQKVLNMQLYNDNNALITNLSHILNERNRLLIECEGLQNTTLIIQQQLAEIEGQVSAEQEQYDSICSQLKELEEKWDDWRQSVRKQEAAIEQCTRRVCINSIASEELSTVCNSLSETQQTLTVKQKSYTELWNRYERFQKQKDQRDLESKQKEKMQKESEEELMFLQKKVTIVESVLFLWRL